MENSGWEGNKPMQEIRERRLQPALKELVVEASRALARLDADRLEEMALSCQMLNRDLVLMDGDGRALLTQQAKEATGEMAVLAKVLEATRANLNVMNRLRELRSGRLEYGEGQVRGWTERGSKHGDN